MARQHADMAVINEGQKEVVNMRTPSAASKCSAANAIHIRILIRPNSLKPLFGTPYYYYYYYHYSPALLPLCCHAI